MPTLSGSFQLAGSMTASGDLRFSTTGAGIIQPINTLTPTGTASFGSSFNEASTNTTAYLEYGVNIIATGSMSATAYCCRLPQTPQKGKNITIINTEGMDLIVFPSTASGDINGVVDTYFSVPADGQSYTFNCYENPLPGGWSANIIPNGNTVYNSGIITYNATSSMSRLAFINNATKASGSGTVTGQAVPYNGNINLIGINSSSNAFGTFVSSYYYPPTVWQKINSIKILTNLTSSADIAFQLVSVSWESYFQSNSTTPAFAPSQVYDPVGYAAYLATRNAWAQNNGLVVENNKSISTGTSLLSTGYITSAVPGTFIPLGGNPSITSTVGGPGTKQLTWNINYNTGIGTSIARLIGKNYIGSATAPLAFGSSTLIATDVYWNHAFSPMFILPSQTINGVKFRMILNITQ